MKHIKTTVVLCGYALPLSGCSNKPQENSTVAQATTGQTTSAAPQSTVTVMQAVTEAQQAAPQQQTPAQQTVPATATANQGEVTVAKKWTALAPPLFQTDLESVE